MSERRAVARVARGVHPTALIDPDAELSGDVEIGPYCIVGAGVKLGRGTRLVSHVVLDGDVTLGPSNVVHPFAVIGGAPQIRQEALRPDGGAVLIGEGNVIREGVTISLSSTAVPTTIGSHNLLMAGAHVGHDVVVGSRCVLANGVQLAGHVVVEDWVNFGGLAGVAQKRRVGESAFVAAGAMCERDVPPFVIVQGDRARVRALNVVGLRRRGVPAVSIAALEAAFSHVFVRRGVPFVDAVAQLDRSDAFVATLASRLA